MNQLSNVVRYNSNNTITTAFRRLLIDIPPWGIYLPGDYNSSTNTLLEARKNGRNATTVNVSYNSVVGNGSLISLPYLYGSKTSSITWPMGSLPSQFTICSLTRYDTDINRNRIINGQVQNMVHANNNGTRRINYYNYSTGYDEVDVNFPNIWYNCCGTNNTQAKSPNLFTNGIQSKIMSLNPPSTTLDGLIINKVSGGSDSSDFQFGLLMVWDRCLRSEQLSLLYEVIELYKKTGILL